MTGMVGYGDNGAQIPHRCGTCNRLTDNFKCNWPRKSGVNVLAVPTWVTNNQTMHDTDGINCGQWQPKFGLT